MKRRDYHMKRRPVAQTWPGYHMSYNDNRMQPFTIWFRDEVYFFASNWREVKAWCRSIGDLNGDKEKASV